MVDALEMIEEVIGHDISAVIATEIGGGNTALALHLGALMSLPLVDSDYVGRSVPELVHSTYHLHGIPLTPSIIVTPQGDFLLFKKYASIEHYEVIIRAISHNIQNVVFILNSPVKVSFASKVAVIKNISKAIRTGRLIYENSK